MTETLEQSNLEDRLADSAAERRFGRSEWQVDAVKLSIGLSAGIAVLFSGMILITYEGFGSADLFVLGFLFLPTSLWIVASVTMSGLGPSAWYRLWNYRVFRIWWNWIGTKESVEEDKREKNEKAENIEARGEDDRSRREREETGFD
jgi:hypothetical protein